MGAAPSTPAYTLADTYTPSNFFSKFNFYTGADPTHGFVDYVNYPTAVKTGLIPNANVAKWGVDHTHTYSASSSGRPSIRMTSQATYNHGLFVADIAHMPISTCGSWPAFWFLGQSGSWPQSGEIDIIEGVNNQATNQMSAHTMTGCTITGINQTAALQSNNCAVSAGASGCTSIDPRTNSYGTGFDNNGGGVYAMEWTSSAIALWFFPRGQIPASITSGKPTPSVDFGKPTTNFQGSCPIDTMFYDMSIVFDTTFCGDWGGAVYQSNGCPMTTGQSSSQSCATYVGSHPSAFANSYWSVNSIKVYSN